MPEDERQPAPCEHLTYSLNSEGRRICDWCNTEALALLDAWYRTPADRPAGYWEDLRAEIEGGRLRGIQA